MEWRVRFREQTKTDEISLSTAGRECKPFVKIVFPRGQDALPGRCVMRYPAILGRLMSRVIELAIFEQNPRARFRWNAASPQWGGWLRGFNTRRLTLPITRNRLQTEPEVYECRPHPREPCCTGEYLGRGIPASEPSRRYSAQTSPFCPDPNGPWTTFLTPPAVTVSNGDRPVLPVAHRAGSLLSRFR